MALLQAFVLLSVVAADYSVLAQASWFEESKIIGGQTVTIEDAPFMVSMSNRAGGPNGSFPTSCGGTLVSERHVLTAAHCVPPSNKFAADNLTVFFGTSQWKGQGTNGNNVTAEAFRAHPKYQILEASNYTYANYDVAVIKLKEAVTTSAQVKAITITTSGAQAQEGAVVSVAGWGYTTNGENQTVSTTLKLEKFTVKKRAECQKELGEALTPQEFCLSTSPSSAFCSGDSGGPAFIGNVQYGVVSWGNCGLDQFPDVLTNLADPEINSFVQEMIKTL